MKGIVTCVIKRYMLYNIIWHCLLHDRTLRKAALKLIRQLGKMNKTDSGEIKDSDRLYGKTKSVNEFFIIRYFDIDPLLKKSSYFLRE